MRRTYGDYTVEYFNHPNMGRWVSIWKSGDFVSAEIDREEWDDWIKSHMGTAHSAASIYRTHRGNVYGPSHEDERA